MTNLGEPLRTVHLRPYRKGMGPTFTLRTFDTGRTGFGGKWLVGYQLTMRENGKAATIFEGTDFGCSPLHAVDSDDAINSLLTFLTLRPGDTDPEYFERYTPEQLAFAEAYGETLSAEAETRFGCG